MSVGVVLVALVVAVWRFSGWGPFVRQAPQPTRIALAAPPAPAPPPAQPAVDPALARLDQLGDSVMRATETYRHRAVLLDAHRASCSDLAMALVGVDQAWLAYNVQTRGTAGRLSADPARGRKDEALGAAADSVDRHFEASRCPRP